MRFKARLMLIGGCVMLLALSIPAYSLPASKQATNIKPPLPTAKPKQMTQRPVRAAAVAPRERSAPVAQVSLSANVAKPAFGWPALVVEARKYMGTNPTARSRLWCATFMNMVLAKVGYAGTNSDAAKSFAYYGRRISEPRVGAIAVLTRGKNGGHVGVVSGIDPSGNPIIISGNHNKRVGEAIYARSRVIAYVMPTERHASPTVVAARGPASTPASESGLESPIAELLAAIEAEQARAETPRTAAQPQRPQIAQAPVSQPHASQRPPVRPPQAPVVPQRLVQQTADPLPQQRARDHARRTPTDPFSELIGRLERAPSPQRQAAPRAGDRVAAADTGRGVR